MMAAADPALTSNSKISVGLLLAASPILAGGFYVITLLTDISTELKLLTQVVQQHLDDGHHQTSLEMQAFRVWAAQLHAMNPALVIPDTPR